ncbi:hypothetical protein AWB74_08266 [Caballeronia arvi]|uniref:Uncharacterized protein n=1 Tax=Caballeronia arvi TaxID=1777135 RepID=A0A158L387_9BURK|nr:hypothetical protein AWB74_08266 [Caballeronia arvi]
MFIMMSPVESKRLTTFDDMEVQRGLPLSDLIAHARDYREYDRIHLWGMTVKSGT